MAQTFFVNLRLRHRLAPVKCYRESQGKTEVAGKPMNFNQSSVLLAIHRSTTLISSAEPAELS
jgi:hypothetical protein